MQANSADVTKNKQKAMNLLLRMASIALFPDFLLLLKHHLYEQTFELMKDH